MNIDNKCSEMNGGSRMVELPNCPKCNSEYTYEDGNLLICPECAHEWTKPIEGEDEEKEVVTRDVNGNILKDGDAVTLIRDVKVKGTSSVMKIGTKIKSIRIIESVNGHDLDCKVDGIGGIYLKSSLVKKL